MMRQMVTWMRADGDGGYYRWIRGVEEGILAARRDSAVQEIANQAAEHSVILDSAGPYWHAPLEIRE
jgi:hypothetical protein